MTDASAAPCQRTMSFSAPQGELIFRPQALHNHGSCVVELEDGQLLACWYRGSGERTADDVAIMGARLRAGSQRWSRPFVLVDTAGFPDVNPCMAIDRASRLWLFWITVLDNRWESSLLKYRVSNRPARRAGCPHWNAGDVLHLRPSPEFADVVRRDLPRQWEPYLARASESERTLLERYIDDRIAAAGDKLRVRLGWMTRPHPIQLPSGRFLLPLYSDGFDFSLMAYTDDLGASWAVSEPIVGPGNVQPSVVRRADGTLVALFRDNGPPPQRVLVSESRDEGATWTLARDTDLPDPGAGLEVIALSSGLWVLINNDTEEGRHRLALTVSLDEGRTWRLARRLEDDQPGADAGSYAYPSIVQAHDGWIHATYTYRPNRQAAQRFGPGETIKHVRFGEDWLREGAGA